MQIVLFLIFILLILLVFIAKKDSLSKSSKIALSVVLGVLFVAIGIYESTVNSQSEYNRKIINAYEQGKTIKCGEYQVDKENFLYVSGTQNFMGKKEQVALRGVILNVAECSIEE